jgi:hypothetical protein
MQPEPWIRVPDVRRRDDALFVEVNADTWLNYTQSSQFFSVFLDGPTKSVNPALPIQGNDFPGAYYFDIKTLTETVFWVSGSKDWRRMRYEVRMEGDRTVAGLFARSPGPLPADVQLHVLRRPRGTVPDPWEALRVLVDTAAAFWPLPAPQGAADRC